MAVFLVADKEGLLPASTPICLHGAPAGVRSLLGSSCCARARLPPSAKRLRYASPLKGRRASSGFTGSTRRASGPSIDPARPTAGQCMEAPPDSCSTVSSSSGRTVTGIAADRTMSEEDMVSSKAACSSSTRPAPSAKRCHILIRTRSNALRDSRSSCLAAASFSAAAVNEAIRAFVSRRAARPFPEDCLPSASSFLIRDKSAELSV
eukprot:scaffold124949_cov26-Tisochrysis_lutea.AAC.4